MLGKGEASAEGVDRKSYGKMNGNNIYLHVITFDVPYPADYGGVIDVFCKLKALRDAGVKIILHCFKYGREEQALLSEMCEEVHYYPRKTGLRSQLSLTPYIVRSRRSDALVSRLLQDDHPILAEGLHCTDFLRHMVFASRTTFCRMANIECHYYRHLARGEKNLLSRIFFFIEAVRLKRYQKVLRKVTHILAISPSDQKYLERLYGETRVSGIYAFHQYSGVSSRNGRGGYILYHGKLDVAENYIAVMQILPLSGKFAGLPLWIAGMNPPPFLAEAISKHPDVKLIANPTVTEMQELIQNAHAHLLLTNQATGLKLKLLAALYRGRFVIANDKMVADTGLENLCHVCNTDEEITETIRRIKTMDFTEDIAKERMRVLSGRYSNAKNAGHLISLINKTEKI